MDRQRQTDRWRDTMVILCYRGKVNDLSRRNQKGLKLTDQNMKKVNSVIEKLIRK